MLEPKEQRSVSEVVARLQFEDLTGPVLHRLVRCEEVPWHARLRGPCQHHVMGKLSPMVINDRAALASTGCKEKVVMIDAFYMIVYCIASSLQVKKGAKRLMQTADQPHKGRFEHRVASTNLHAHLTAAVFTAPGKTSDEAGEAALLDRLAAAEWLIADCG